MNRPKPQAAKPPAPGRPARAAAAPNFVTWLHQRRDADADANLRKGQRTRARLLVAAAQLLEQHGYDALAIADVCEHAGITRTALYKHFPHKQALMLALLTDFQDFLTTALAGEAPAARNKEDAVLAANLAYVRLFRANAPIIHAVQEARRALDAAERLQFDMNEVWARKVALGVEQRQVQARGTRSRATASPEALATAYALEAMADGFLTELYLRRNPNLEALDLSEEQVASVLTRAWLGVLRGP